MGTITAEQTRSYLAEMNGLPCAIETQARLRSASDELELTRLAALSPMDFDREKKSAAKKMGISIATLVEEVRKRRPEERSNKAAPKWDPPSQVHPEPVEGAI